jgi:hypothetical protein
MSDDNGDDRDAMNKQGGDAVAGAPPRAQTEEPRASQSRARSGLPPPCPNCGSPRIQVLENFGALFRCFACKWQFHASDGVPARTKRTAVPQEEPTFWWRLDGVVGDVSLADRRLKQSQRMQAEAAKEHARARRRGDGDALDSDDR